MPEYKLSSGETFETIILPKGTILFGGIELHTDKPHPEYIFTDLFGSQDTDGYYCVDPYENKFFYPAPLVGDSVSRFSVHMFYHTNYDIELVLMANPSKTARSERESHDTACIRCNKLSDIDMCGKPRKEYDPCLSPLLITEYPYIQGYIAIADKDASIFKKGQLPALGNNIPEVLNFVRPFIVANSRKIHGIPEIVLFPYHARPESVLSKTGIHPRSVESNYIEYAISNRTKLNYFPLAYVTETGFYSFKELLDPKKIQELASSPRENINFDSPLITNMIKLLNAALSTDGFYIGDIPYKFTIDLRTGVYVLDIPHIRRLNYTVRKLNIVSPDHSNEPLIVPFHYPLDIKKKIHTSLSKNISEEVLEETINKLYGSYSKHYQLNKGVPVLNMSPAYTMQLVLLRPELDLPRKRYTLKHKTKKRS